MLSQTAIFHSDSINSHLESMESVREGNGLNTAKRQVLRTSSPPYLLVYALEANYILTLLYHDICLIYEAFHLLCYLFILNKYNKVLGINVFLKCP